MSEATIKGILADPAYKGKARVLYLAQLVDNHQIMISELISVARNCSEKQLGTIVESIEHVTKTKPGILDKKGFLFVVEQLRSTAPRVRLEAARVIANTASLFPDLLDNAVPGLLGNTSDTGTVVRWSAATALTSILACKTSINTTLRPHVEQLEQQETNNAIKKIYARGIKKSAG